MIPERILYIVVILALLAINYGLTQRLVRQSGQPSMKPFGKLDHVAEELGASPKRKDKEDTVKERVVETYKINY